MFVLFVSFVTLRPAFRGTQTSNSVAFRPAIPRLTSLQCYGGNCGGYSRLGGGPGCCAGLFGDPDCCAGFVGGPGGCAGRIGCPGGCAGSVCGPGGAYYSGGILQPHAMW